MRVQKKNIEIIHRLFVLKQNCLEKLLLFKSSNRFQKDVGRTAYFNALNLMVQTTKIEFNKFNFNKIWSMRENLFLGSLNCHLGTSGYIIE